MSNNNFGIPTRLFSISNPELPELIGLVVMLSALLEFKIGQIAFSVENGRQEKYAEIPKSNNAKNITKRLLLFEADGMDSRSLQKIQSFIDEASVALQKRDGLIHRVWSHNEGLTMIGHRTLRDADWKNGANQVEFTEYPPEDVYLMKEDLVSIANRVDEIVSIAASLGAIASMKPKSRD
jgi:hypothetical protein